MKHTHNRLTFKDRFVFTNFLSKANPKMIQKKQAIFH